MLCIGRGVREGGGRGKEERERGEWEGGQSVGFLLGKQNEEGWFEEDGEVHHRELRGE